MIDFLHNLFHPNGMYDTEEDVAYAFGQEAILLTLANNREHMTWIKLISVLDYNEEGKLVMKDVYTYSPIMSGMHANVIIPTVGTYAAKTFMDIIPPIGNIFNLLPDGDNVYSFAHTHPNCACHDNENFSRGFGDEFVAKLPFVDNTYMVVSGTGKIYVYEIKNEDVPMKGPKLEIIP